MSKTRILVVDDEEGIRFGIRDFLEERGYEVEECGTCAAARQAVGTSHPDGMILDYALPDGNALDVLPSVKAVDPGVPVIILTGHGSIDLAVRAIKEGAEHFLTKPVELPALLVVLERALEHRRAQRQSLAGKARRAREAVDPFLGASEAITELRAQAEKVLRSESPLLLLGETGTGKGELAKWLHAQGPRGQEAFVDLNCAGLTRDFLETELFGHEKGSFTGAVSSKLGMLEVAHQGTVFLDEVGDVDPQIQPKLLKVLEEKRFRRLGETRDRRVDIRLIAATHQDLKQLVQEGRFRSDLYFRISAIPMQVPPLRERVEDIPALAAVLLRSISSDLGRGEVRLSAGALERLRGYRWPGNIRELRNVLDRVVLLTEGPSLDADDLYFDPPPSAPAASPAQADLTLAELERRHIEKVLAERGGRVTAAARQLGIPRSSLYQKIKQHGIVLSRP
jgi:DNA-binding NtrC family response regulator